MRPRPLRLAALSLLLAGGAARAQSTERAWALDRHEPSPAGDAFFLAEHPWYSSTRALAAGVVMEHALDPLVLRREYADGTVRDDRIVSGMLVGHLVAAGSFLDRVSVHASMPFSLSQSGAPDPTMATRFAPAPAAPGDLRLGARTRIFGQSDTTPFSLHLGVVLWLPTGSRDHNTGDERVRVEPRIALAGRIGLLRWAFGAAFAFRPDLDAASVRIGDELHLTAALGAALLRERFHVGVETVIQTTVRGLPESMGGGSAAFTRDAWGGEALLGARYTVLDLVAIGAAAGFGFEQAGGTPSARFILSAQYAPSSRTLSARTGPR